MKAIAIFILSACALRAQVPKPVIPPNWLPTCATTPPSNGVYKSQCLGSDKSVYTCATAAGCTASGDWGSGGASSGPFTRTGTNIAPTNAGDTLTIGTTVLDPLTGITAPSVWIDPIASYHASGSIATTTGSITSGSNSLIVASATGWSVGMGIAVANAGSGGTTELISSVTAVSGTTFTLANNAAATSTTQTVNHDDSAALCAAAISGKPVQVRQGDYNVTSACNVNVAATFVGAGRGLTNLWNRGTANDVFQISWVNAETGAAANRGGLFTDFSVQQAAGITPTAGYVFNVSGTNTPWLRVTNGTFRNIVISGTWGGITTGNGISFQFFENIKITDAVGMGVFVNSQDPNGNFHFLNVEMQSSGLQIGFASVVDFTNLKIDQGQGGAGDAILFSATTANATQSVRFINPSIEGPFTCGMNFTHANSVIWLQIIGGSIDEGTSVFCNNGTYDRYGSFADISASGVRIYSNTNQPPSYTLYMPSAGGFIIPSQDATGFSAAYAAEFTAPVNATKNYGTGVWGGFLAVKPVNPGLGTGKGTAPVGWLDAGGSTGSSTGDFVVDSDNKKVYVGRLSTTGGDSLTNFIIRNRLGTVFLDVNPNDATVNIGEQAAGGNTAPINFYRSNVVTVAMRNAGGVSLSAIAFASLPACSATPTTAQVPNGTMIYCSDCKNVTDDTTGTFDSVAASGGNGTIVLCEHASWRVH